MVNEIDFAQPVPRLSDSAPTFAASSIPPGSPVTDNPWIPLEPTASVTTIMEFNTGAG